MSVVPNLRIVKQSADNWLGKFLDDSTYDSVVNADVDIYRTDPSTSDGEQNCVLKFRKGFFTKAQQEGAYVGLRDAALPTQNRGLAAGPITDKCQQRDWVTNEQLDILKYLSEVQSA